MPSPVDRAFLRAAIEDLQGTICAIDMKAEVLLIAMTVPFEQMKLAYICGRKIAMFNAAVRCIAAAVYCGLAILLLHVFF